MDGSSRSIVSKQLLNVFLLLFVVIVSLSSVSARADWTLNTGYCYTSHTFTGPTVASIAQQNAQTFNSCNTCGHTASVVYADENSGILKLFVDEGFGPPGCAPANTFTYTAQCIGDCLPTGVPDQGANLGGGECPNLDGNPINAATGNKFAQETDISLASGLVFSRAYNSESLLGRNRIGSAWRHNYQRNLYVSPELITAIRADGRQAYFHLVDSTWVNQQAGSGTLTQLADSSGIPTGWQFKAVNDATETYDIKGKLLTLSNRDGHTQTLNYDTNTHLASVSDDTGRTLTFTYPEFCTNRANNTASI